MMTCADAVHHFDEVRPFTSLVDVVLIFLLVERYAGPVRGAEADTQGTYRGGGVCQELVAPVEQEKSIRVAQNKG